MFWEVTSVHFLARERDAVGIDRFDIFSSKFDDPRRAFILANKTDSPYKNDEFENAEFLALDSCAHTLSKTKCSSTQTVDAVACVVKNERN